MKVNHAKPVWANDRLRLVVTAACNINCFYCHNEGQPKANQFLSDALFTRIVQLVQATPPRSLTFTGGEALLHPHLDQFVRTIKALCPSVTLVTNGILLDDKRLTLLVDAGITKIRFGVDSLASEKWRPSSGSFPALNPKQRIAAIRESGVELELNIVLTKFNLAEIPEIFRFCAKHGVSAKVFEHVEVERFGTATTSAEMYQKPLLEFPEFEKVLNKSGIPFNTVEAQAFHGANYVLKGDGFSWRYCRYLCPFGLCYMTGTRVDPTGAAYVCMEKRFVETLSITESLSRSQAKLRQVNKKGCCRRTA